MDQERRLAPACHHWTCAWACNDAVRLRLDGEISLSRCPRHHLCLPLSSLVKSFSGVEVSLRTGVWLLHASLCDLRGVPGGSLLAEGPLSLCVVSLFRRAGRMQTAAFAPAAPCVRTQVRSHSHRCRPPAVLAGGPGNTGLAKRVTETRSLCTHALPPPRPAHSARQRRSSDTPAPVRLRGPHFTHVCVCGSVPFTLTPPL